MLEHAPTRTQRTIIATQNKLINKIGFWAAFVALVGAVGYIVSVPLQILNVVNYVQDSIIAFGFSLIIPAPFLVAMLALHSTVSEEKKFLKKSGRKNSKSQTAPSTYTFSVFEKNSDTNTFKLRKVLGIDLRCR